MFVNNINLAGSHHLMEILQFKKINGNRLFGLEFNYLYRTGVSHYLL